LLLKAGANLEAQDNYGETPLGAAATGGYVEVVDLLIRSGANLEPNGRQPLACAAGEGHVDVADVLIRAGASLEAIQHAIHCAAYEGNSVEVVELLISAGANPEAKDEEGWTPILVAAQRGHMEVLEVLRKASPNSATHIILEGGPFDFVMKWGDPDDVKLLISGEHVDAFEALLMADIRMRAM